ncbi:MAG: DJ-1/PfpI family protein [Ruminococcus sp.]|nr:DJ-1/PfpI family protein [Ruminococcus sp.]
MVYCFLADGFEEIEALGTVDILRRAGIDVVTASVNGKKTVTGSHGIEVSADIETLEDNIDFSEIECAVYPGGMPGAETLSSGENTVPVSVARYCYENDILLGAICAAPIVLGRIGLLEKKNATCYPGFENELKGAVTTSDKVVCDGNIVTSKGPGCTIDFALALVSKLKDEATALSIRKAMQCDE